MNELPADVDLGAHDLREWVELGLARAGHLLTAGERLIAGRVLDLRGPPARLYARLTARRGTISRVDQLAGLGVPDGEDAAAALIELGLADTLVPWPQRASACTVKELKAGCKVAGLPVGGRRDDLVQRLQSHRGWSQQRWLRVRHRGLLRRMGRWATWRRHPDRAAQVVRRLGHVRWPEYATTRGAALHPDRRHLIRWEALVRGLDVLPVDDLLVALENETHWAPGRLDLRRSLARRIAAHGREIERQKQPDQARGVYERLIATGHVQPSELAVRIARTFESQGSGRQALATLADSRAQASPVDATAIARAGRRLARKLRSSWPPDRPRRSPSVRDIRLSEAPLEGPRPGYRTRTGSAPVEAAVKDLLASLGRVALHVEGGLWRTLFALLFAETYFLPVPGALPTQLLSGPVDLGSPAFARARQQAVDEVLAAVRTGQAAQRVHAADLKWRGVRLRGASWDIETKLLVAAAASLPASALAAILQRFLDEGWSASRGLPDLVLFPGPVVAVPGALPSKLPAGLVLAEVKGPRDSVRDEQSVWFDVLLGAGASVELWQITG